MTKNISVIHGFIQLVHPMLVIYRAHDVEEIQYRLKTTRTIEI